MIELKNVTMQYVPDINTLLNFNLKIDKNTLIIGDEFLGSTSILRLIAKLDKPTKGKILIDNSNIVEISNKDLSVAYIPKEPYLFNSKSIEKNLSYPLKIRKIDKNLIKNEVDCAILLLNSLILKNNLKSFPNKPKQMSISEKKILTLVRALVRKPKYVLIEDFFSNLDSKYITIAIELISELKSHSIIIASSSSNEIENIYKDFKIIDLNN